MNAPSQEERLKRVLGILERMRQRWVDAGAPLTAFGEIDAAIDDVRYLLRQGGES